MSGVTHLLPVTVDVLRQTSTPLGHGRFSKAPAAVVSGLAARIAPAGAREMTLAAQLKTYASHVLYTEPDADVRVQDEILELAPSPHAGRRFRVTGLLPPSVPHHLKALLEEIQRPATV